MTYVRWAQQLLWLRGVNNKTKTIVVTLQKHCYSLRFSKKNRISYLQIYWHPRSPGGVYRMADSANGRYKYLQKIGEGVHGMVLKSQDLTTGKMVAIKKVSLRTKHGDISLSTVREIKALQHCDCKYVSIRKWNNRIPLFRNCCMWSENKCRNSDSEIARCVPRYDWVVVSVRIYAAYIILNIEKWIDAIKSVDHSIVHDHVIAWRQIYA